MIIYTPTPPTHPHTHTTVAICSSCKMSDEEWLVAKAKGCLKHDIHAAKAWLITARTLFPRNYNLQVWIIIFQMIIYIYYT